MKVITKVVISIKDQLVIHSESYDYDGPVALCKGGGGSTSTTTTTGEIDYEYNRRMAAIAEQQQGLANEYAEFWREEYKPLETAQIEANMQLVDQQTDTERQKLAAEGTQADTASLKSEAERSLIGENTELAREQIGLAREEIRSGQPVMSEYYKQALQGEDPNAAVGKARADVASGFKGAEAGERRALGRLGVTGQKQGQGAIRQRFQEQAKATAFASTSAREGAESRNFQKLSSATTTFKGGLG
jgi:hypothetical protein